MSTVDQHDHLPVEQLADFAEGLITEPAALATTGAHLSACAECQQVLQDLRSVSALLQGEPVRRMPASVAIRMEAVLAAEASLRRMDQVADQQPDSILAASTTSRRLETVTAAAGGSPELDVTAAAGELSAGERPRSLSDARRRRRSRTVSALAPAATVAAFAVGAAIFSQNMSGVDDVGAGAVAGREQDNAARGYAGPTPATGGTYRTTSGQDFTAYTLSATARGLLTERALANALTPPPRTPALTSGDRASEPLPVTPGAEAYAAQGSERLSTLLSPAGLAACVAQLVPDPAEVQVLAIDVGTYDGAPAALLVLTDPTDPAKAQVRVVGEPCGHGQAAEFLRTEIQRG